MAVNPAVRFPVYYGNTQAGGNVYVPGNPNNSTPNGAFGPFGQDLNNELANPGNIFGSDFNGFLDPLNLANNYAITPLKPPAAPGFSPGTMPTQNFTNNDFGDFNTPSMQATAGGAHPGILVQPPAPAPPPPPPAAGNGGGPPAGGIGLQAQQSNAAHNVVSNSHITGLNPSTLSNDYLFAKGGTPHDLLLSGGTPAPHSGFIASLKSMYGHPNNMPAPAPLGAGTHLPPHTLGNDYLNSRGSTSQDQLLSGSPASHIVSSLKSKYGQTPNTAISKSGMTVPSSYNTTESTPALRSPSRSTRALRSPPTSSTPPLGSSATNTHPAGVPSTKFSGRLALTGGGR